ncbi:RNA-guided endonuclease IscB [Nonomuraea jabiensis]|uniref:RNA-guided endonuclease IscB n=1 Tax=Nonomuraea jabiensis TaxID=882448 RepID=UPI0036CBA6F9
MLDSHGRPLQPCTPARARQLLKKGRAVVHRHTPFVIRLKDRIAAGSEIDGVELGVDPGSRHTGIAMFIAQAGERRARYGIQLDHRGAAIRMKMEQRAAYRRGRRSRKLRYRAPRFSNRARPPGWLAPSLRHRVITTVSWAHRLARWAPVRAVHVERVVFDTHALAAGRPMEGGDYQQGTLHGTEVREYLLAKWGRRCAYCGARGVPLNIDHIQSRSRGGSDRVSNLTLACVPCNQAKGSQPVEAFSGALACARIVASNFGFRARARTRTDKHGFLRLRLPRQKRFFGYATGDLVTAVVPTGKKQGTHTGRVAVRSSGSFNVTTARGTVQGISRRHVRLLQRADGYAYTYQEESCRPHAGSPLV